ncbi:MAG: BrnA antitoxin family protein [Devosia sp.]|nr:BrnA antitoxin family protein [Devosia sp.]
MTKFSNLRPLTNEEEAEIQRLIATDPDNPELTDEQLAQGKSFADALPDLYASIQRSRGRPRIERPKQKVTIRLDVDLLEKLRASGKGWQSRVNDHLRRDVDL